MDKVLNLLGLALRAGKIISGEDMVVEAIRKQDVSLVIVANDTKDNTRKKITDKASFYNVPVIFYGEKATLGKAIGKESRAVIGIKDKGFAKSLLSLVER